MNERTLFDAYRAAPSTDALVGVLQASKDPIYNLCYRVLRQPQDAEDATQKVFLKLIDFVPKLTDGAHYRLILCRIALHVALDELRSRKTRTVYETRKARMNVEEVRGGAEQDLGPLYEHLARLSDPDRSVLVDHYFEGRPLEEIASAVGCSKVAIWKRVEKARDALRLSLRGAGLTAFALGVPTMLEAVPFTPAPRGLLDEGVRAKVAACAGCGAKGFILLGGSLIAMGKTLPLWIAVLLLGAGLAGSAVLLRRDAGPSLAIGTRTPPSPGVVGAALVSSRVLPTFPEQSPQSLHSRKAPEPYPYRVELPRPEWSKAKKETWKALHETMLDPKSLLNGLDLSEFVAESSRSSELIFVIGSALPSAGQGVRVFAGGEPLSAWNALSALVNAARLDFALRENGTVYIDDRERVALEKDPPSQAEILQDQLGLVARSLDKGWAGTSYDDRVDREVLDRSVALSGIAATLKEAFERLGVASGVPILLCNLTEEEAAKVARRFEGGPINMGGEEAFEGQLRKFCFLAGLDYCLSGAGGVIVSSKDVVATDRLAWEAHDAELAMLEQSRLTGSEARSIPEFAQALEKATSLRVIPSLEAWESDAEVGGAPLSGRAALDELPRQCGLRWALRFGKVWIFK